MSSWGQWISGPRLVLVAAAPGRLLAADLGAPLPLAPGGARESPPGVLRAAHDAHPHRPRPGWDSGDRRRPPRGDTTTDLAKVQQAITDLVTLLGDTTVTGSIRAVMGDPAAPSGTGSLRALRSQSNTAVISAASIKALIGLTIDLAQRVIDGDAATRRVARQTLRLARLTVGSLDSADVGTDLP